MKKKPMTYPFTMSTTDRRRLTALGGPRASSRIARKAISIGLDMIEKDLVLLVLPASGPQPVPAEKNFSVRMDDELVERIAALAEKTPMTRAAITRQAMRVGLPTLEKEST